MSTRNLIESASLVDGKSNGDTWVVRLINEGRGSSGVYSAKLLETYGHAFNNAVSFLNHPIGGPETRNFTELVGRVVGETWTERGEDGTLGVYANWEPDPDHKEKLSRYKENLGLSIYISGTGSEDENGDFLVESLDAEDPFRSVDVVMAAGRGGRFELTESVKKMYESRRSDFVEETTTTAVVVKGNEMELEEKIDALVAEIKTLASAIVAEKESAVAAEAQVKADEEAVAKAVESYDAAVKAVDEADLLQPQREALLSAAKRGEDITAAIESAKAVKEAAVEAARVSESAGGREYGTATETRFGAWS